MAFLVFTLVSWVIHRITQPFVDADDNGEGKQGLLGSLNGLEDISLAVQMMNLAFAGYFLSMDHFGFHDEDSSMVRGPPTAWTILPTRWP